MPDRAGRERSFGPSRPRRQHGRGDALERLITQVRFRAGFAPS
jgi:hypothetical protein